MTLRIFKTSAFTWLLCYFVKVKMAAAELLNERLISKLSEGDLVATEMDYHKTCLSEFYNKVKTSKMSTSEQEKSIVEGIAVAEIERYMGGIIEVESDNIPLFYLKELKNLYVQQIKYHGYEKILKHISELRGRDVMGRDLILTLKDDCGNAIFEPCDLQDDGMFLERGACTIQKKILSKQDEKKLSNKNDVRSKETFSSQSEIDSISLPVMNFINMVLNGSSVDTSDKKRSSSA